MSRKLLVTYFALSEEEVKKSIGDNEILLVGRNPGVGGIKLEAEKSKHISRVAIEIHLRDGGVSIRNKNRFESVLVEVAGNNQSLQNLRREHEIIIPGDGKIVIDATYRLDFLLDGEIDETPINQEEYSLDTYLHGPELLWKNLHDNYKDVCVALVAAWHISDFVDINSRTVPTNQQVAILLNVSLAAANKKIDRTKEKIAPVGSSDLFFGEHGKQALADWVDQHNFVTSEMVSELPGLERFARRDT